MPLSEGEQKYADTFQFSPLVKKEDILELRDLLYKYAHNLREAYDYLEILEGINSMDSKNRNDLVHRIHGMALQCFALQIRKLTDKQSERSIRKLINLAILPKLKNREFAAIVNIYSHYEDFLNVAHQASISFHDGLSLFPDTKIIRADLKYLNDFYDVIVNGICVKYIGVDKKTRGYGALLDKLV